MAFSFCHLHWLSLDAVCRNSAAVLLLLFGCFFFFLIKTSPQTGQSLQKIILAIEFFPWWWKPVDHCGSRTLSWIKRAVGYRQLGGEELEEGCALPGRAAQVHSALPACWQLVGQGGACYTPANIKEEVCKAFKTTGRPSKSLWKNL